MSLFLPWGQSASKPSHTPRHEGELQDGSLPMVSAAALATDDCCISEGEVAVAAMVMRDRNDRRDDDDDDDDVGAFLVLEEHGSN